MSSAHSLLESLYAVIRILFTQLTTSRLYDCNHFLTHFFSLSPSLSKIYTRSLSRSQISHFLWWLLYWWLMWSLHCLTAESFKWSRWYSSQTMNLQNMFIYAWEKCVKTYPGPKLSLPRRRAGAPLLFTALLKWFSKRNHGLTEQYCIRQAP